VGFPLFLRGVSRVSKFSKSVDFGNFLILLAISRAFPKFCHDKLIENFFKLGNQLLLIYRHFIWGV